MKIHMLDQEISHDFEAMLRLRKLLAVYFTKGNQVTTNFNSTLGKTRRGEGRYHGQPWHSL
jgi:hypothetical protein